MISYRYRSSFQIQVTFPAVLAEADQSRHEDRRLEIHPEVESLCSARGSCTVMNPKKPSSTIIWLRKPPWGPRGHTHFSLLRCRHLRSQRSHVFLLRCRHHRHHRSRRPDGGGDRCGVKAGIRGGGGSPGDGLARLSWQAKSLVDRTSPGPSEFQLSSTAVLAFRESEICRQAYKPARSGGQFSKDE